MTSAEIGISDIPASSVRYLIRKADFPWRTVNPPDVPSGEVERLLGLAPHPLRFFKESEIEELILDHPSLVPGVREPAAIANELPVPRTGPADFVLVDADGQITLVECKLEANSEIRGQVIGQLITYASGLWGLTYDELKERFRRAKADLTRPFENDGDWDEATFRTAVTQNLSTGNFRLFVVADEIPTSLDRSATFLNERSSSLEVRVLGVRLHHCVEDGTDLLVLEDESSRSPPRKSNANRKMVLSAIRARDPVGADVADDLLDWAESVGMTVRPLRKAVAARVPGGDDLFKVEGYRAVIRVSLNRLRILNRPEQRERVQRILTGLEDLDFELNDRRAKVQLQSLGDGARLSDFKALMRDSLEVLVS